jgi:hypothetical protein
MGAMRTRPYIGVTGFTTAGEALDLLRSVQGDAGGRRVMIGVLASVRTLRGHEEPWGARRHPRVTAIADLFPDHPLAWNAVHFHSAGEEPLAASLEALIRLAGPRLHGVQLNIAWPAAGTLAEVRAAHPGVAFILQIAGDALAAMEGSVERVARRLAEEYAGLIDGVLFDASRGRGIPFVVDEAAAFLAAVAAASPGLILAVAGGLSPETLYLLEPLVRRLPALAIDAEGRLRDAEDRLVPERAAEYVQRAVEMLPRIF